MFQILSDLSLLLRRELSVDTTDVTSNAVLTSGLAGVWVTLNSSGKAVRTQSATALAWPVFNESRRDGTVGWTPDVTNNNKVTVLAGKYFARTDQYDSNTVSAVGPLKAGSEGQLVAATEGVTTDVVAYCTKAPFSTTYLGRTLTVIEIYVM